MKRLFIDYNNKDYNIIHVEGQDIVYVNFK